MRRAAVNARDFLFYAARFFCVFFFVDEFFYAFSSQSTLPEAFLQLRDKSLKNVLFPGIFYVTSILLYSSLFIIS
jgi:hypothetical protein